MSKLQESRFLYLKYETAFESLGHEYYSEVSPARFPKQILRFRNDEVLQKYLEINSKEIEDHDFISAFAFFQGRRPFLATMYHGYQFGVYNPNIGDGRGFIYGQGSGETPYSRGLDGRLTLKGGVRELIAAESLYRMGVNTSRCFCVIETGENLTRSDEPYPTRSCVMVRFNKSHIRFGTFERLQFIKRPDLIEKLLDHVISIYYPDISEPTKQEGRILFYDQLCTRVARLVAQWMSEGFCHGVLNTDNMNVTGESFDYGPYGFIHAYNPEIVATSFDYSGRYRYLFL